MSCVKSDKLPQVTTLEAVQDEDKFDHVNKSGGVKEVTLPDSCSSTLAAKRITHLWTV